MALAFFLPPFPASSYGISISASATVTTAVPLPVGNSQVRIVNEGPNIAFLAFGQTSVAAALPTATALNTCTAVLPGEDLIFTLGAKDTHVSAICRAAQTAALTVYTGNGI